MNNLFLEKLRQYSIIGIRGLTEDENYNIGDICRPSYDWDYENDISTFDTNNPIELNGTCAIDTHIDTTEDTDAEIIEKVNKTIANFNYIGEMVIIAGYEYEYGADNEEVTIADAEVIHKID